MSGLIRRTKEEIEENRDKIKQLVLMNKSPREISLELILPYNVVVSDINVISKRWQDEKPDLDISKAEQLERLNLMEKELWESWYASKTQTRKTTLSSSSQAGNQGPRNRTEEIIEQTPGESKYMEQIMKIIQERNKLLGLYAATKTESEITVRKDTDSIREEVLAVIEEARLRSLRNTEIINTIETTTGTYVPVGSQLQLPESTENE